MPSTSDLMALVAPGSFALTLPGGKLWIGRSKNILGALARNLEAIKTKSHSIPELNEIPLDWEPDLITRYGDPVECYYELYTLYSSGDEPYIILSPPPLTWRSTERLEPHPRRPGSCAVVWLRNKAGRKVLAGAFETMIEARGWVQAAFKDPDNIPKILRLRSELMLEMEAQIRNSSRPRPRRDEPGRRRR
jgi:hypothetical protein